MGGIPVCMLNACKSHVALLTPATRAAVCITTRLLFSLYFLRSDYYFHSYGYTRAQLLICKRHLLNAHRKHICGGGMLNFDLSKSLYVLLFDTTHRMAAWPVIASVVRSLIQAVPVGSTFMVMYHSQPNWIDTDSVFCKADYNTSPA